MMCLGSNARPTCETRGTVVAQGPGPAAAGDITWFWMVAAAIGLGALVKGTGEGVTTGLIMSLMTLGLGQVYDSGLNIDTSGTIRES